MSRLLEILGRAITTDTAELICHWLNVVAGHTDSDENIDKLTKTVELIKANKTDAASEQLKSYLFDDPSSIKGRMAAAAICLQTSQLTDAIEQLNSVYLRQPTNTMALYTLGHCYERLGCESQAIEFYQDCLKFKNYLQLPRQRLAAIYFKNGQLEKTIHEYEQLKDEYPDDLLTLIMLGNLYIAKAKYGKAADIFNNAILIHPDNFLVRDDEIDQLIMSGELYDALERLDDLLTQQPDCAELLLRKADVLAMLGSSEESIRLYEEAISICPDYLEVNIKLGTQYLRAGQQQLAARQCNKAAEINDQIVGAYIGLAKARKLSGNNTDAVGTLSLAAAVNTNTPLLIAETAKLQFAAKNMEAGFIDHSGNCSANLFESVLIAHKEQTAQQPRNPEMHYRMGILLISVGRLNDAVLSFQQALKINPTYYSASAKLSLAFFETGLNHLAFEQLTASDSLDKNTVELHYRTALLYCDRIRFASSLIDLERHMEDNFAYTNSTVNVSIVLQNLGLLDRASVMWDNLSDMLSQGANKNQQF